MKAVFLAPLVLPLVALGQNAESSASPAPDPLILRRADGIVIHFDDPQKRREYEMEHPMPVISNNPGAPPTPTVPQTQVTAPNAKPSYFTDPTQHTFQSPAPTPNTRAAVLFSPTKRTDHTAAATPLPEPPALVALDVRLMQSGANYQINWITDYGSYDVTGNANKALDIQARNLSQHPAHVSLQWAFTARKPRQDSRFIFDLGSSTKDLRAGEDVHFGVCSAQLAHRSVWYAALGQGSFQGSVMDGWIVEVRQDGKIIKSAGSTSTLESMVGSEPLQKMVADYRQIGASKGLTTVDVSQAPAW